MFCGCILFSFIAVRTPSSVAFGGVMALAEHLAVGNVGAAALAPGGDVVGLHLFQLIDSGAEIAVAYGAEGAVGVPPALASSVCCL